MNAPDDIYDCLIIGGGPAGLTAAEYLGRFLRKAIVIDGGHSRAGYIPESHNYPGFPKGINGRAFLEKMREHVTKYGVEILYDTVASLTHDKFFSAQISGRTLQSKTVILATGMVDHKPQIENINEFIYDGIIRFCPICDGFEAIDKTIAIAGPCAKIYRKAVYLRTYSRRLILLPLDNDFACDPDSRAQLQPLDIKIPDQKIKNIRVENDRVIATWADGQECAADLLYPAMGATPRLDFLHAIDLKTNADGCVFTDAHQQCNIENLYAIGDITTDLSQIAVATGQAAIAATAIHNGLPLNCR